MQVYGGHQCAGGDLPRRRVRQCPRHVSLVYVFPEMPSDGLLFTDAIYVVGRGTPAIGASAVFITYQMSCGEQWKRLDMQISFQ